MTSPDSRRLQVALTGTRLDRCSDEELLARLQARFRLSREKGAALLKGRCIVKRDIDASSALKLVAAFREVGLQAVVQEMASAAAAQDVATATAARGMASAVSARGGVAAAGAGDSIQHAPAEQAAVRRRVAAAAAAAASVAAGRSGAGQQPSGRSSSQPQAGTQRAPSKSAPTKVAAPVVAPSAMKPSSAVRAAPVASVPASAPGSAARPQGAPASTQPSVPGSQAAPVSRQRSVQSPQVAPASARGSVPGPQIAPEPGQASAPRPQAAPASGPLFAPRPPAAPASGQVFAPRPQAAPASGQVFAPRPPVAPASAQSSAPRPQTAPTSGQGSAPKPQAVSAAASGSPPPAAAPAPTTPKPPARPAPASARSAPLEALLALGDQHLPKPRVGFGYVASLLLVTLLCVTVPLIYVGLTAGIAYGWFWYLTHIHEHLPRNAQLVALMYAVPGLTGAVLVLFLLRPLFSARPRPRDTLTLDPNKESGFISGVHALCRAIGVSPPSEIRLSWDANASVQFQNRWMSLLNGQKVLTIGLSMAGGLSARQFVGVLAHEFGHFAQRFGMICSFIVNSINAWLEHCAYGEDALMRKLEEWSDAAAEKEHWLSWLVNLSLAATWLAIRGTRFLMAQLFHLSLRFSRYMSRQMEFDADRYEALLAGSHIYRTTARSLRALNHAFVEVNRANIEAWQEHRLLRDLPDAVAAHAHDFDPARLASIEEEMQEQTTTRYWDSHPPDVERIDNAEKLQAPGMYVEDAPAALLFKDFAGWCQRATRLFYAEEGVKFSDEQLRSRDDILGHVRSRNEQREQLNRFFNGQFQPWPLLPLMPGVGSGDAMGWQECIDQIRARSPEIARNWLQAHHAQERRELLRTGVALGASSNQLGLAGADRSPAQMAAELEQITSKRMPFDAPLLDSFSLYGARIEHAIDSMESLGRDRAAQLRDTVAGMATLERDIGLLEELAGTMRHFAGIAEESGKMPPGFGEMEAQFGELALQVLAQAGRIPQPVTADETVGGYLRACCREMPALGASMPAEALARAAWPMPAAFQHLYMLALGELIALCESAEKDRGIRPIRLVA